MTPEEIDELADRFFAAIERADLAAVERLYTADVAIWHNVTAHTQDRAENLKLLGAVVRRIDGMRYADVRRSLHVGGFVQQHRLRGRTRSGADLDVPVCIVAQVREGRIARIDEYLDGPSVAPMLASTEPAARIESERLDAVPFWVLNDWLSYSCGTVAFAGHALSLEFEVRRRVIGSIQAVSQRVSIPGHEILGATFRRRLHWAGIRVRVTDPDLLEKLPWREGREFSLWFTGADRERAEPLALALGGSFEPGLGLAQTPV